MPFSHHSHSGQFCKHAEGSLEEVVIEAIKQKFKIYGLTEHAPRYQAEDLYPEEIEADLKVQSLSDTFDAFISEAKRLKIKYAGQITLLVGMETENIHEEDLAKYDELLDRHRGDIDYLIGSVHHVNGIAIDFDEITFRRAVENCASNSPTTHPGSNKVEGYDLALRTFMEEYFDAQYLLMKALHPEVIGHFDLCRLYIPSTNFDTFPSVVERIQRNIRFAIDYGAVFEVNSAAFRKGWDTAYPGRDVIQMIRDMGGRLVLSDDSHGPHAVGLNYDRLLRYLHEEVRLEELFYLGQSTTKAVLSSAGRRVEVSKVDGKWWEDEWWACSEWQEAR